MIRVQQSSFTHDQVIFQCGLLESHKLLMLKIKLRYQRRELGTISIPLSYQLLFILIFYFLLALLTQVVWTEDLALSNVCFLCVGHIIWANLSPVHQTFASCYLQDGQVCWGKRKVLCFPWKVSSPTALHWLILCTLDSITFIQTSCNTFITH